MSTIDNNTNRTLGDVVKDVGSSMFNRTVGRLFGAGLPIGGESTNNKLRASARWTRSGENDFRVKVVLPPKSDLWQMFFGTSAGDAGQVQAYDFGDATVTRSNNPILAPLAGLGGVAFPLTPSIIINHVASYSPMSMPHSNYPHYAYNHSEIPSFTVTAEFPVQNAEDARYWVAMLHFFRSVTKMFFGGEANDFKGNPPPILQLSGYGDYVFNSVPIVVTAFSVDMRADVDYICTQQNFNKNQISRQSVVDPGVNKSWAPTMSTVTAQLQPIYSRDSVKKFNMRDFVNGRLTGDGQGKIGYI